MAAARGPIVVVGSVNMDLVGHCPAFPAPGETVLGSGFATVPGGKGSNQAIAAARAGGRVAFVGAVGEDAFAAPLRAALSGAGVDVSALRTVPGASGVALITVDGHGENTIVVLPGANSAVTLDGAGRELVGAAGLVVLQLEIPIEVVTAAATAAAAAGIPVLLNASPARELPEELARAVTVAVVNEGEARTLGDAVLSGIPHVVTTLGADGARYRGPDGRAVDVPSTPVTVVDTTGAGDAFTGALAVGWAEGGDPAAAVRRACAAGALATTVAGASTSAPTREAIDALLA
ncbi:ribokinase [Nakamurella endophytica]|uniref:Ribokinase n=1 Tax=Nakamurella endophytica TaxID=1748367 RepID=A0A917SNL4_9ACTN|nr:ribokinase [Nakamurella endophytica]GGL87649.1 ribokinase [Nakamurella endophytica]